MITIKLNHEIYKEFHILTKKEVRNMGYMDKSLRDPSIKCGFLPGYGTTLFFENMHFLIIDEKHPVKKFAIWKDYKVIGYVDITQEAADKANGANNAIFYFGFDPVTAPEKYKEDNKR